MSWGTKPERSIPASRLIPVKRPFFNSDRLRYLAEQNEDLIYSGIVLLFAPVLFMYFGIQDAILFDGQEILMQCLLAGAVGLRCISLTWIARLAWVNKVSLQDQFLLAIFLPATALLVTGFTIGEPVRYIEIATNQEIVAPEISTAVADASKEEMQLASATAKAVYPVYAPASVNPTRSVTADDVRRRQAIEEAELARIAS
ncbi:MAG: hypothetical protein FGM61_09800 [Sediminibacterium sp.]|nr:hypothetical protein [Sediminibacterium sp.]